MNYIMNVFIYINRRRNYILVLLHCSSWPTNKSTHALLDQAL